jgi:hypothetical protein
MKTKHTPVTWNVTGRLTNGDLVVSELDSLNTICHVIGDNADENAALIAAAPELLEMLQHAVEWIEERHGATNDSRIYRSIINKAKGL